MVKMTSLQGPYVDRRGRGGKGSLKSGVVEDGPGNRRIDRGGEGPREGI